MLYHIDTDGGVDDALAFVVADRALANIRVLSTVVGNVSLETATQNVLLFRELLRRTADWSVVRGAELPSDGQRPDATHIHGEDGLGGATALLSSATMRAISAARVRAFDEVAPHEAQNVTVIGIGPATNIARIVSWYGRALVRRIVLMTGAFFDRGNMTPYAEFNAHSDAPALQAALDLGISVLLVPLDLTRKVQLPLRVFSASSETTSASDLSRILRWSHLKYADACRASEGIDGCLPHDAITVLAAAHPERFQTLRGRVTVSQGGSRHGQTRLTLDDTSHVEVATGGDLKWVRTVLGDAFAAL